MQPETTTSKTGEIFTLAHLAETDIAPLIPVIRQWVKSRFTGEIFEDEVQEIVERMHEYLEGKTYKYYVIRSSDNTAVGMCATREPEAAMHQYKSTPSTNTLELINVFLNQTHQGMGLGKALLEFCFSEAKSQGVSEVIWNSGPRYRNSAWDFYIKLVGEPITIAKEYYGEDGDAPIWRKIL